MPEGKKIRLIMTLIEGHAEVDLVLDESNRVVDVFYRGVDVRFFETLWIGLNVDELPRIVPMICGVCTASHHVSSAKAVNVLRGVYPLPEGAERVYKVLNWAMHLHNLVLHPLVFGLPDALPVNVERRSVFRLAERSPELVKAGLKIINVAHEVIEAFGGRELHPVNCGAGGVAEVPSEARVRGLLEKLRKVAEVEAKVFQTEALKLLDSVKDRIAELPAGYDYMVALVNDKEFDITFGKLKLMDAKGGGIVKEVGDTDRGYREVLSEYTVEYSYVKAVVPPGSEAREVSIATGPLARLNLVREYGVEEADELRDKLLEEWGRPATHPLLQNYARIVEAWADLVKLIQLLEEGRFEPYYREPTRTSGEGVGVIEAPRGTLVHHYAAEDLKTVYVNVITPTTINASAIEADLRRYFEGKKVTEMSSREVYAYVASVVRSYDPCMACSTHGSGAAGAPVRIYVRLPDGTRRRLEEYRGVA